MEKLKLMFQFLQEQILGMKWMNELIGKGLSVLGVDIQGRVGGSIQFFLYDVIKITILLCLLIFIISYIQSYFPPERSKKILGRFHGIWANIISALLGTVTPFCSCSSIPIFMGFTSAGLPLGVTFSFLISSPMVDLGSLVLLMSIFGAEIAFVYVILGLAIAVIGGTLIEKMHMETYVEEFIRNASHVESDSPTISICEENSPIAKMYTGLIDRHLTNLTAAKTTEDGYALIQEPYFFAYNKDAKDEDGFAAPITASVELPYTTDSEKRYYIGKEKNMEACNSQIETVFESYAQNVGIELEK